MGNILEKKCLNYCCFATFSVGWGGVEWLEKLEIKPTQKSETSCNCNS